MSKQKRVQQAAERRRRTVTRRTLLAAGAVAALGGGYLWLGGGSSGRGRSFQVTGGERAPVLDPLQFGSPRVRLAYAAAARHPAVLDRVYCYCYCDRPPTKHKSLLSCFTDFHGAG